MHLIDELQGDKRFKGTCPNCGEEFRLADAVLFSIQNSPPAEALAAIAAAKNQLKEKRLEIEEIRKRMTIKAKKTSEAVHIGKMVEKIAPSFPAFSYSTSDCRALFEPIDYVIFSGLAKTGAVESITFADIKSGAARLSGIQKSVKETIESGKIDFKISK